MNRLINYLMLAAALLGCFSCKIRNHRSPETQRPASSLIYEHRWGEHGKNRVMDICSDGEGGIVLVGEVLQNGPFETPASVQHKDVMVARLDSGGEVYWKNVMIGNDEDGVNAVIRLKNQDILVSGTTWSSELEGHEGLSDARIWKISATGELKWGRCLGGEQKQQLLFALELPDSSIIASIFSHDFREPYDKYTSDFVVFGYTVLTRIDQNGNVLSEENFGWIGGDPLTAATINKDGIVGLSGPLKSEFAGVPPFKKNNMGFVSLDDSFHVAHVNLAGGNGEDYADGIVALPSGNFLVAGGTQSTDGDLDERTRQTDGMVAEFDPQGRKIGIGTLRGPGHVFFRDIQVVGDKVYVLGAADQFEGWGFEGYGGYDHIVCEVDPALNIKVIAVFGTEKDDFAECFWVGEDGTVVIGGWVEENHQTSTAWVWKYRLP